MFVFLNIDLVANGYPLKNYVMELPKILKGVRINPYVKTW